MATELRIEELARSLVELARSQEVSIAVAESLTGGALASAIVAVPGASHAFAGGVVAYDIRVKAGLLGVDRELLDDVGAIDPRVAVQMAEGIRQACARDGEPAVLGVATTGVAGPKTTGAHPVGEVYVAVALPGESRVESLMLEGDREQIRAATVAAALGFALAALTGPVAA